MEFWQMAVGANELGRLELGWREPEDWEPRCKLQKEGKEIRERRGQQPEGLNMGKERSP